MPKKSIPAIIPVGTVKVIRSKGKTVKDPIRFPKILEKTEKSFTDSYLKMLNSMVKMEQIELLRQAKK